MSLIEYKGILYNTEGKDLPKGLIELLQKAKEIKKAPAKKPEKVQKSEE